MLTLKLINEETERVIAGLEKKRFKGAREAIEQVLAVDKKRREAQQELDKSLNSQKQLSGQIGKCMKEGKKDEAEQIKQQVSALKETSKQLEEQMAKAQDEMTDMLCQIPNIPYDEVPQGSTAEDNRVVKSNLKECTEQDTVGNWDVNPSLGIANPLPHWELAKKYNLIDFDLGVKITGAGFPVYTGKGAQLQRALINFFLDEARKSGYTEIMPPTVVNQASGYGTGQLPDKEGQMYLKNCAYTQCFRREAGSYGKDVRGLNRLHEFSKIEIVRIDKPEHSKESHKEMLAHVEGLLKKLELPYRILLLCGGDQSFTSSICYDFEVYSEAQGRWLEVSSVSNFDTYQANRLKCRYRRADNKKIELCHTLNGSALALPRIVAALLENNQTDEGIRIPKALVPYTGFEIID